MIHFNEIDAALRSLGKDRAWLADASGRKPASIRVALAPKADPKNRSELIQKALSDAIERERGRQSPASIAPPGYSEIFFTDEELNLADRASRLVSAPSLAQFCHDVIQTRARGSNKLAASSPLDGAPCYADYMRPETAPRDRKILGFFEDIGWYPACWSEANQAWNITYCAGVPETSPQEPEWIERMIRADDLCWWREWPSNRWQDNPYHNPYGADYDSSEHNV